MNDFVFIEMFCFFFNFCFFNFSDFMEERKGEEGKGNVFYLRKWGFYEENRSGATAANEVAPPHEPYPAKNRR